MNGKCEPNNVKFVSRITRSNCVHFMSSKPKQPVTTSNLTHALLDEKIK